MSLDNESIATVEGLQWNNDFADAEGTFGTHNVIYVGNIGLFV